MFRAPKDTPHGIGRFYQKDYTQGFTTECPTPFELEELISRRFVDSEKDYTTYLDVLRAIGLRTGSVVFDFGCSWGYGSWQLRHAGYQVYSYDVSVPRARYASEQLQCILVEPGRIPEKVDCFFAAHVVEHLPNPRSLWELARKALKPSGCVVLFLPNGDPAREPLHPAYHQLWGQVHPLLLSPGALTKMGRALGFDVCCYSSPYVPEEIANATGGRTDGHELLIVASRTSS